MVLVGAGVVLPTPVAECRYWHRSLNPKKLVEVGFSGLGQRMTISRSIKLYKASRHLNSSLQATSPELLTMQPRYRLQLTGLGAPGFSTVNP